MVLSPSGKGKALGWSEANNGLRIIREVKTPLAFYRNSRECESFVCIFKVVYPKPLVVYFYLTPSASR